MPDATTVDAPAYRPLLDELREVAALLPPSHIPVPAELARIVGALVHYAEHGADLIEAARGGTPDEQAHTDAVATVLVSKQPDAPKPGDTPANTATDARVAALEAQLAAFTGQPTTTPTPTAAPESAGPQASVADLEADNERLRQQVANLTASRNAASGSVSTEQVPPEPPLPAAGSGVTS